MKARLCCPRWGLGGKDDLRRTYRVCERGRVLLVSRQRPGGERCSDRFISPGIPGAGAVANRLSRVRVIAFDARGSASCIFAVSGRILLRHARRLALLLHSRPNHRWLDRPDHVFFIHCFDDQIVDDLQSELQPEDKRLGKAMTKGFYNGFTYGWPTPIGGVGGGLYVDNYGNAYPQLYYGTPRAGGSTGYSPDLEGLLTGASISASSGTGMIRHNFGKSGNSGGVG